MAEETFDVRKHGLVPKHTILSDEDTQKILISYSITKRQLPQISIKDPALEHLDCKEGDVLKIERKSETAGTSIFYRLVI